MSNAAAGFLWCAERGLQDGEQTREPVEQAAEAVCGGKRGADGAIGGASRDVTLHAAVGLQVPDLRFDRRTRSHRGLDGGSGDRFTDHVVQTDFKLDPAEPCVANTCNRPHGSTVRGDWLMVL